MFGAYRVKGQKRPIPKGGNGTPREQRIMLDWRHGKIGPLAPYVLCSQPALCRSPVKDVPCHKSCAEAWIVADAQDDADLAQLVRTYTPGAPVIWESGAGP